MVANLVVDEDVLPQVPRNPRLDYLFVPAVLTTMIACVGVSIIALIGAVNPTWSGAYLLIGMVLATLEGIYSHRILKRSRAIDLSPVQFRLAEWGILILLLKGLFYLCHPWEFFVADIKTIAASPWSFFSLDFNILLLLAFIAWLSAINSMQNFEDLYDPYSFRSTDVWPYLDLRARFFWGGGVLVFISGIHQIILQAGYAGLVDFNRPGIGGILLNVLVYFVLGLVTLSQANFITHLTRWKIQGISAPSALTRQWIQYGVFVLALVALIIFFLPTRYTMGFLTTANFVLGVILQIAFSLYQIIMFIFTLPFILVASLISGEGVPAMDMSHLQMSPPEQAAPPAEGLPWWEAFRSIIFWLVILTAIGYLIKTYFKDHPELITILRQIKWLGFSFNWLGRLWRWLMGIAQSGVDLLPRPGNKNSPLPSRLASLITRPRFRLGAMSAREQIIYYYLSVLRRSEKSGLPRHKSQTPAEFAPKLNQALPEVGSEISQLTQAFIQARYSLEPLDDHKAGLARSIWQKIRAAFNNIRLRPKS